MDLIRLLVAPVGTDIADMRIRQRDDLSAIGRIGQDFLIAGHRGIKNNFALGVAISADGLAPKQTTVFQDQERGFPQGSLQNRRAQERSGAQSAPLTRVQKGESI